ncbi:SPOR domain-containing protein [Halomonas getboli]|uniref:SPOR domain-containing protein n=1 Tax=Halomonas getboli TaxID=2935862 RepID=UPI001FFEB633|nr:SPOR domain-containing protein [Halomonas getboli]MCK2183397.1 SPOR domain-containing protein [Halomonas getboli]
MKYGWRERISGALILLALAVIFLPLLFDDPAPREERPQPTMSIEQPIEVPHREPEAPAPPEELAPSDAAAVDDGTASNEDVVSVETGQAAIEASSSDSDEALADQNMSEERATAAESASGDGAATSEPEAAAEDPIADLARAADERMAAAAKPTHEAVSGGEWAVQVGSFGEPDNAQRLEARLEEKGFPAYRRPRNNDLTTVYVGPYASSEVAEQAMSELKAGFNLQGLLVEAE